MPIPKDILAVPRPKSTVVKERAGRWIVIKRTCKRVNGKNKSVDIGMIGEIINYEYHENRTYGRRELKIIQEREEKADVKKAAERFKSEEFIDEKDYGNIQCLTQESVSLLNELEIFFGTDVSKKLYSIALLRVAYPDIRNRDLDFRYKTSYLSNIIPGVDLSEDTVSKFLLEFGMRLSDIDAYMSYRIQNATSHAMAIDGMLKDSNARENSFCEFSRKARQKGIKNYNLITIYSVDDNEPLASYIYPGNMVDVKSVHDVLERSKLKAKIIKWKKIVDDNGVTHKVPSTILMGNKSFFSEKVIEELGNSEIPYILPLERDNRMISEYKMNKYVFSPLKGYNQSNVYYKKEKVSDSLWLYSFRDADIALSEEKSYRAKNDSNDNFEIDLSNNRDNFGLITFICNVDLEPIVVYLVYQNRWTNEDLFELFKATLDLDTLNVQKNYRLYATEFINLLAAIIASRFWHKMRHTILKYKRVKIVNNTENATTGDKKDEQTIDPNFGNKEKSKNDSNDKQEENQKEESKKNQDVTQDINIKNNETQKEDSCEKNKTQPKTRKKAVYLSDVYCFREILMLLTKAKMRRVGYTEEWLPTLCVSRISDICNVLKIKINPRS